VLALQKGAKLLDTEWTKSKVNKSKLLELRPKLDLQKKLRKGLVLNFTALNVNLPYYSRLESIECLRKGIPNHRRRLLIVDDHEPLVLNLLKHAKGYNLLIATELDVVKNLIFSVDLMSIKITCQVYELTLQQSRALSIKLGLQVLLHMPLNLPYITGFKGGPEVDSSEHILIRGALVFEEIFDPLVVILVQNLDGV